MDRHTADELYAWADALYSQATDPANKDDPKWLNRRADRLRNLQNARQYRKMGKFALWTSKVGRQGARDKTPILLAYRHGLRVSSHPIRGVELRAR
jgi:hypothetical protein